MMNHNWDLTCGGYSDHTYLVWGMGFCSVSEAFLDWPFSPGVFLVVFLG